MKKKRVKTVAEKVFLYLVAGFCLLPALLVVFRSFMPLQELAANFHIFPRQWSTINYEKVFLLLPEFYDHFWNTVGYTCVTILFGLPVSILAGYAFCFLSFRLKRNLFLLYVVLMLMPFQAILVPQYLMLNRIHLLNAGASVVLPNIFATFGTVLMTQYMMGIDRELLEAGKMDGLGKVSLFTRLIVPMCMPIIGSYIVLTFFECWGMVEQPMIFLKDSELYPLALWLNQVQIEYRLPGSVVYSILPLLLYAWGKDHMLSGIGFGSIK